ncbi:MAG: ABC transporter ATP-binding protein [Chloroflexota bacterium]
MSEIRVEGLTKTFGPVVALDDVSFVFPESEVTCLLGPSGCGKTTLMRIIAGLETPTRGEVYFGDQRVTRLKPSARDIGMVFQYPVVYRGISVRRNIELPLLSQKLSAEERRRRIDTVVQILGLEESLDKDITQLDNGTRQKVAVARAVARQPRIILFDEPITNVDAQAKLQLKRSFKELTRQLRQTIIYVTHDQTEAMTLADRIALMQEGKIVQCAEPRELYNHPEDVFAGWFLGNPGMNFISAGVVHSRDGLVLVAPFFASQVPLHGAGEPGPVTAGIRPEHVVVRSAPGGNAVQVRLLRKTITIGRQYLLALQHDGHILKAKVPPGIGTALGDTVWVELPLEHLVLFDAHGRRASLFPRGNEHAPAPATPSGRVVARGS